jgi:hypothetical protein
MKLPDDPKDLQPWHQVWVELSFIKKSNTFERKRRLFMEFVELLRNSDIPLPEEMIQDLEDQAERLKAR